VPSISASEAFACYLVTGCFAGALAGLLGVGGGLVIVPVLLWVFTRAGYASALTTQLAIGTSLATIVFTSLSSIHAHHRRGAVRWDGVVRLAPGIVLGAALGAFVATGASGRVLQLLLAAFAVFAAAELFFGAKRALSAQPPSALWLPPAGVVIGGVSSLLGIGGGTLTVPFLVWARYDIRHAVGSSGACGLPIAVSGAATYVLLGLGNAALPREAWGYVHAPAVAGVAITSVVFARLGARWAHALPREHLRKAFAVLLGVVATKLVIGV
jgi:uncharacterized membrane protein YfcA